jgi:IS1 family transposase
VIDRQKQDAKALKVALLESWRAWEESAARKVAWKEGQRYEETAPALKRRTKTHKDTDNFLCQYGMAFNP